MFSMFASKSWFGVEGFTTHSEENKTYTFLGVNSSEDSTVTLMGIAISGTIFPNQETPFGIGYQIGAGKIIAATNGSSEEDVSDYPLTFRGSLLFKYNVAFSKQFSMEFGAGGLYESMTREGFSEDTTVVTVEYNTLSFIANTNLLFHVSDSFALLGGVSIATPLSNKITLSSESLSYNDDIAVTGYTVLGQLGLAFSL